MIEKNEQGDNIKAASEGCVHQVKDNNIKKRFDELQHSKEAKRSGFKKIVSRLIAKIKRYPVAAFLLKPVNKNRVAVVLVILFLIIYFAQHLLALNQDLSPRFSDNQFLYSLYYYDHFFQDGFVELYRNPYPPLAYLTTMPFYHWLGVSDSSAYLSILIYLFIFLLSMLGIGYELGGWCGGFTVMCLAASAPRIAKYSRTYYLDFPQTAMTALAFYLLLKSNGFQNRKYSLLFAVTLMLSFMAKWSSAFYLAAPVLWFFIPLMFKSKRSFKCSLLFFIPLLIILLTALNSFKTIPLHSLDNRAWFFNYLISSALPCVLSFFTVVATEKYLKRKKDFDVKDLGIFNFGYMASLFFLITLPWFYFSGNVFLSKFFSDSGHGRNYSNNWNFIMDHIQSDFSFVLPLMIIGVVFMLFKRDKFYMKLSLLFSLLAGALIMTRVGYPTARYNITFLVFSAALAGYWVSYTASFRKIITGLLMGISLFSLLFWIMEPPTQRNHSVYRKLQQTGFVLNQGPYQPAKTANLDPVIAHLKDIGPRWRNIVFYYERDFYCDPDYFCLTAYGKGKRIEITFGGAINSPKVLGEHLERLNKGIRGGLPRKFHHAREILFMYKKGSDITPAKQRMMQLFRTKRWMEKEFIVGEEYRILLIEMDGVMSYPNIPGGFY